MTHPIGSAADKAATTRDLQADIQAARAAQRDHTAAGRHAAADRTATTVNTLLDELSRWT
ncbi:hypothetical protein QNO07_09420 [Streptomyces sp. 549]|uniref:hypothetical protein n=1 Tax=Streptomyces sp. 549 TaxID=3049076 RepID=UPI0024C29B27|nr:hypothetical protein [Streptomyces sp. 549]MDK1473638.1 hypothetical protein [Streptomyces sp. 549]